MLRSIIAAKYLFIYFLNNFQFVNVILLTTEAVFLYIPSIWIVFTIVFLVCCMLHNKKKITFNFIFSFDREGLLAGAAYVNTFYRVAFEVKF
jgi:battenin